MVNASVPMLAHNVFFTLKESTSENRQKLVDSCHEYLSSHPGVVFYAAGQRSPDLKRPVNDLDFDVAVHVIFKDKESQDEYQQAPRHLQFISENKETWKQVRVFDSDVFGATS